jgi:hypothetical protein
LTFHRPLATLFSLVNYQKALEAELDLVCSTLKSCSCARAQEGEKDVDQTKPHSKQARQFTRDDCARIAASTVNIVLEKLSIQQIVQGIAVFPAGEGTVMVDIVMRDFSTKGTWDVSITIPPAKEQTDELP